MENITYKEEKNKSFFNGLLRVINKMIPKSKRKNYGNDVKISGFSDFLLELDKNDPAYETVERVTELCDEAIVVAKQRLQIIDRVQGLDEQMRELECYDNLTDEEMQRLRELLDRFLALSDDKNVLRFQITGFDKGLVEMEYLEDDARFSIPYIEESERNQKILKRDISYLQGEKADLEYQNDMLRNGQDFIYKFSIFSVVLFGAGTLFMAYAAIIQNVSMFFPLSLMSAMLIMIVTLVSMFKRRLKVELKVNLLKQHRAVQLMNKKNVVYAYYTSFLNFVYKKYNVRSVEKLKKNIKDYGNYKHLTTRFDSLRSSMYETEAEIEQFLRDKNIVNTVITTEKFAKTVNIEDKRAYYQDLKKERDRLEIRLQDLDGIHEGIWNDLVVLNDSDKSHDRIIDRIMKRYLDQVSRIVSFAQNRQAAMADEPVELLEAEDIAILGELPTVGEILEKNGGLDKIGTLGYNAKNKIV